MKIEFMNNPIAIINKIILKKYSKLKRKVIVYFVEFASSSNRNVTVPLGITEFPDSPKDPIIVSLDMKLPTYQLTDIYAHEMAHVLAGPGAKHGPVFKKYYSWIYDEYCKFLRVLNK